MASHLLSLGCTPQKIIRWNLRNFQTIFQTMIFRFYVHLRGCSRKIHHPYRSPGHIADPLAIPHRVGFVSEARTCAPHCRKRCAKSSACAWRPTSKAALISNTGQRSCRKSMVTRWAPYQCYNASYSFIRPFIGAITQFITSRGPPCRISGSLYHPLRIQICSKISGLPRTNPMTWGWDENDHQSYEFSEGVWILRAQYIPFTSRL